MTTITGNVLFSDGELIFSEGDPGHLLYVIQSGSVVVSKTIHGQDKHIATLSAGEFFGEMSLLNDKPRAANAKCVGDVSLLTLSWDEFSERITEMPLVARKLIQTLSGRLNDTLQMAESLLRSTKTRRVLFELLFNAAQESDSLDDKAPVVVSLDSIALSRRSGVELMVIEEVLDNLVQGGLVTLVDHKLEIPSVSKLRDHMEHLESF